MVDSGGQYHFGTTDVTRTISLNNNNYKLKKLLPECFKGHLNLTNYKLTKNTSGAILDRVAKEKKLKKMNLDYAHGTGHGVGYFLNVHEGLNQSQNLIKLN